MIAILRLAALLLWFLSPVLLTAAALFASRRSGDSFGRRLAPLIIGVVLVADWVLFVLFLMSSETPYGSYYKPSLGTLTLVLMTAVALPASLLARKGRLPLVLASVSLLTLWVCFVYAPGHWLTKAGTGSVSVSVDGRQVPASAYFGHPTDSEADAIVLVRLRDGSDYFLDFGSEKLRRGNRSEYVRLFGGVWCFENIERGAFVDPLPPRRLNQFQTRSIDGHLVTIQF